MKKYLLLFIVFIISTSFVGDRNTSFNTKWIISEHSNLSVNGTTNVGKFSCKINEYAKTDTVVIAQDRSDKIILTGAVNIEVLNFSCSNFMMTRELRKTLKADQFPHLIVKFLSLKEIANPNQKVSTVCGNVEITIAGVSKRFEISYQLNIEKNKMTLVGVQPIHFSDFKLTPPKKVGHLVRANDKLSVIFNLNLRAI
ncbi:MAG: YceI family protein [Flavobacterium sp.]|nr:MAG: YceI family protein [Flavobacterium sp.]